MNNQILYDKVISVTLYRPPHTYNNKYTIQTVSGYSETVIGNNKILYNYDSRYYSEDMKQKAMGGKNPGLVGIEFYEGDNPKIFTGYSTKQGGKTFETYKTIPRSGNTYFVKNIEQMKTGRSGGNLFKTGDRIRVKSDNSIWTAVVGEGFTGVNPNNHEINYTTEEPAETLTIDCTDSGLKPDMALSINLLPGQNCYNAILKIRNLNLEGKDIRLWSRMVITAGYRTGATATYTCPIFASYIEEPNPDGITVFEGITVGVAEGILNNRYTEIIFRQEKMRLIDLTTQVAKGISESVTVECAIDDSIMNQEITMSKQTVYAQNGAAILSWLQTTISQFIQNISTQNGGEKISAFLQLVDNKLQIIALNGPNKTPDNIESIVSLDMVSGATFNGTALTVVAPWNPALQPGNLFYMPPEFINGSKLPNVLPAEDYRNEDNLYRALTIAVSFASVENTNKMEVLAIPAQWAGQLPNEATTSMTADTLAQVLNKDVTNPNTIFVGDAGAKEIGSVNKKVEEKKTGKKTFDESSDLIGLWGTWTSTIADEAKGNCLSMILEHYLFDDPNGPHLVPRTKGTNNQSSYYEDREYFRNNALALSHFQTSGCKANTLWWPITMVGTYWRKRKDDEAAVSNNWADVDINNPDKIPMNKALYIPVWGPSWESMLSKMQQIKDIWKWAYLEYSKLYGELSVMWRAMYYYLGGTDDIG